MLCRVAAVKSLPVHHHSGGYILFPLGWGGGWGVAYAASQTTVLHMKRLNQTVSPIFVILCVLCFKTQSFFSLILLVFFLFDHLIAFHRVTSTDWHETKIRYSRIDVDANKFLKE